MNDRQRAEAIFFPIFFQQVLRCGVNDKLRTADPIHASPFEHVAQADDAFTVLGEFAGYARPSQHRNFRGFRQLRATIEGE